MEEKEDKKGKSRLKPKRPKQNEENRLIRLISPHFRDGFELCKSFFPVRSHSGQSDWSGILDDYRLVTSVTPDYSLQGVARRTLFLTDLVGKTEGKRPFNLRFDVDMSISSTPGICKTNRGLCTVTGVSSPELPNIPAGNCHASMDRGGRCAIHGKYPISLPVLTRHRTCIAWCSVLHSVAWIPQSEGQFPQTRLVSPARWDWIVWGRGLAVHVRSCMGILGPMVQYQQISLWPEISTCFANQCGCVKPSHFIPISLQVLALYSVCSVRSIP